DLQLERRCSKAQRSDSRPNSGRFPAYDGNQLPIADCQLPIEIANRKSQIANSIRLSICLVALWCLARFSSFSAGAAAPTLDHLFPVAVHIGTTIALTCVGKFELWPPKVWVDVPGMVFTPETNKGAFTVQVAPYTPTGPHLIRLFNEQGASRPRFFIV